MALIVRDNKVFNPALRDGAPNVGALSSMVMTGANQYFTESIDVGTFVEMIVFLHVKAHSGSNPTLDIRLQYSHNQKDFIDSGDTLAQVTTTDGVTLKKATANFGKYIRFALVLGGTTPSYTLTLAVAAKG